MGRSKIVFKLSCLVAFWLAQHGADAGQILTPLQTQSIAPSGDLIATNWGPGTTGITNPLAFDQFNPSLGTLDAVYVTMSTTIRNDYMLKFPNTPTTIYVATTATQDASILADPGKVAQLTDGPTVILFAPNGAQIFGPPATRQPVDLVQMTQSSPGTWSSLLPITDPHYISPTMTQQSYQRTLDTSNASLLLPDFIGTGKVDLPLTATAFSSFFSSSGNGGGGVLTKANATVTIQYAYTVVPEPSSAILAILGIGTSLLACQLRRRAAHRRGRSSDRGRTGSDIHHV